MSAAREGGCQCGGLRYAVSGEPLGVVVCHCRDCQIQSGSAFGMTMVVRREHFQWIAGKPRHFTTRADSGAVKQGYFCGDCGTRILHESDRLPATFNVKPGTLDDTSWLEPRAHVWVSRKQPWISIPDSIPRFQENPTPGSGSR